MAMTRTGLSFDEFLALPEEKPALEYFYGVVTAKMSPKGPHAILQPELTVFLHGYCRRTGLARVMTELRTNWAGVASLVPDVAVYLVERIPTKPNGEVADDFFVPPDVAAKIMSPGQSMRSMRERAQWFVDHGVKCVLIVEPRGRSVFIVRPSGEFGPQRGGDIVDLGDVLPDFSFVVRDLFAAIDIGQEAHGPSAPPLMRRFADIGLTAASCAWLNASRYASREVADVGRAARLA